MTGGPTRPSTLSAAGPGLVPGALVLPKSDVAAEGGSPLEGTASPRIDGNLADWRELRHSLQVVECELNTACNRTCAYCPQSLGLLPASHERMAPAVLEILLGDLARIGFGGRFSHHLFGEPLLDDSLGENIRRIRAALPAAVQVLFTNGDLLDDARYHALAEAGIAAFVVTRHSVGPYPERANQFVQHAKELQLTSRAGSIQFLARRNRFERFRQTPCFAPSEMAIVSWDGRLLRCYEDARRAGPLGNLNTHTLAAIWGATRAKRSALQCGDRSGVGGPCATCDNANHRVRGSSFGTEAFWTASAAAAAIVARGLVE